MPIFLWNPDTDDYTDVETQDTPYDDPPYDDFMDEEYEEDEEDFDEMTQDANFVRALDHLIQRLLKESVEARELVKKKILEDHSYITYVRDIRFGQGFTLVEAEHTRPDGTVRTDLFHLFSLFTIESLLSTLGNYLNIPKSSSSFNVNKNT
jgi:hypothetical protein